MRSVFILLVAVVMTACQSSRKELKVLQFNIWQEGTSVENGYWGIVDNIVELSPDLITFSEVRNYNGISFISRLVTDLEKRGMRYYGKESVSTGICQNMRFSRKKWFFP